MENRSVGQFRWRTFFQEWEGERKMEAEGGKAKQGIMLWKYKIKQTLKFPEYMGIKFNTGKEF